MTFIVTWDPRLVTDSQKLECFTVWKYYTYFLSSHEVSGIVNTSLMKILALKGSKEHSSKIKIASIFSIGDKRKLLFKTCN